jgi:hypothetical protein
MESTLVAAPFRVCVVLLLRYKDSGFSLVMDEYAVCIYLLCNFGCLVQMETL